jgi:hypothetical protein
MLKDVTVSHDALSKDVHLFMDGQPYDSLPVSQLGSAGEVVFLFPNGVTPVMHEFKARASNDEGDGLFSPSEHYAPGLPGAPGIRLTIG